MFRARTGQAPDGADPVGMVAGRVRAVLVLGGVPLAELDDAVQQVRLKLVEHGADPGRTALRDPHAWAVVVASRVAADWHRSRRRDRGLRDRLAEHWSTWPPPGQSEDERVLALAVAAGMEALPAPLRQVLALRFYADLPVRDIAAALGVPDGTVKSRLHAAVRALRERLRKTEVI